jgi:hypothetical protein
LVHLAGDVLGPQSLLSRDIPAGIPHLLDRLDDTPAYVHVLPISGVSDVSGHSIKSAGYKLEARTTMAQVPTERLALEATAAGFFAVLSSPIRLAVLGIDRHR